MMEPDENMIRAGLEAIQEGNTRPARQFLYELELELALQRRKMSEDLELQRHRLDAELARQRRRTLVASILLSLFCGLITFVAILCFA